MRRWQISSTGHWFPTTTQLIGVFASSSDLPPMHSRPLPANPPFQADDFVGRPSGSRWHSLLNVDTLDGRASRRSWAFKLGTGPSMSRRHSSSY